MNVCTKLKSTPRASPLSERSHSDIVMLCSESDNNDSAWLEFYTRFDPWIKRYVTKAWYHTNPHPHTDLHPAQLLPELVQDVYVMLLREDCRALLQYRGNTDNSWLAYLSAICINGVREYLRKQAAGKRSAKYFALEEILIDAPEHARFCKVLCRQLHTNPEAEIVERIDRKQFWQHCMQLLSVICDLRDRRLFLLSLIGYSNRELARKCRFKLKATGIESVLRKIRKKLLQALTQNQIEPHFKRRLKCKKGRM